MRRILLVIAIALIAAIGLLAVPASDLPPRAPARVDDSYAEPVKAAREREEPLVRRDITGSRTVTFEPVAHEPRRSHGPAGFWEALELRGTLLDPAGKPVAAALDPVGPISVEVPTALRTMTFSLPGYRPAGLELGPGDDDADLGTVVLSPDAKIDITVVGPPELEGQSLNARLEVVATPDTSVVVTGTGIRSREGPVEISWPMLSGLPHRLTLFSDGIRGPNVGVGSLKAEFTLAPGEQRSLVLDLGQAPALDVQLTGLPAGAAAHQVLALGEATVRTDADGRCRILAPPEGPFRMILASSLPSQPPGEGVPLVDATVGTHRFHQSTGTLRVRPGREVLAVAFTARGQRQSVASSVSDQRLPLHPAPAVSLLERSWWERENPRLGAFVEGFGSFWFDSSIAQPTCDPWLLVPLPRDRAELIAVERGESGTDWTLVALRPEDRNRSAYGSVIRAVKRRDSWHFPPMADGEWLLQWRYKDHFAGTRTLADPVTLVAGQRHEMVAQVPQRLRLRGRFDNWADQSDATRPDRVRFVGCDPRGAPATIASDGTFETWVFGPGVDPSGIEVWGTHIAGGVPADLRSFDPLEMTLVASLRPATETEILVQPRFGSPSIWIPSRIWNGVMGDRFVGQKVPQRDGSFRVVAATGFAVMVRETEGEGDLFGMIRGWARITPGTGPVTLDPGGRFVTLRSEETMRHCYVTPEPPGWWTHGADRIGHALASGGELRLWIPEGCTAVLTDGTRRLIIPRDADEVWVR